MKITLTIWFLAAIHILLSLTNAYITFLPGADSDAMDFHETALEYANSLNWNFAIGGRLYEQFLGAVYTIFGSSLILGQLLSVSAFVGSCLVLLKIMDILSISRYRIVTLLVYGLLPTNLVFCSITLREAFQILFFMSTVYFLLYLHSRKNTVALLGFLFSVLLLAVSHNGLLVYSIFILVIAIFWPAAVRLYASSHLSRHRAYILVVVLFILFGFVVAEGMIHDIRGLSAIEALLGGNIFDYIIDYRESAVLSRATYSVALDTSSWSSLLLTSVPVVFSYLFEPLPWHVKNLMDTYAMGESLLRLILITLSLQVWWRARGPIKKAYGLLLALYFSMAFMWALGTSNYGTAIRHNLVHYWIIVLLGVPALMARFEQFVGVVKKRGPAYNNGMRPGR